MVNFRRFNGTSDVVTLALGGLSTMTFGTVAVLCRRTDNTAWNGAFATRTSGGAAELYIDIAPSGSSNNLWYSFASTANAGVTVSSTEDWVWTIIAKATASSAPRTHKKVMSTGVWTRANGAAIADATSPLGGSLQIGNAGGDFFKGDIAAVAVWTSVLSDAALDAMSLNWPAVLAANPTAAWLLNQASTATSIPDSSTTGTANQTALSGTTVQSGTIPNWSETGGSTPSGASAAQARAQAVASSSKLALGSSQGQARAAATPAGQKVAVRGSQGQQRAAATVVAAKVAVRGSQDALRDATTATGQQVTARTGASQDALRDATTATGRKLATTASQDAARDGTTATGRKLASGASQDSLRDQGLATSSAVPHVGASNGFARAQAMPAGFAIKAAAGTAVARQQSSTSASTRRVGATVATMRAAVTSATTTRRVGASADSLRAAALASGLRLARSASAASARAVATPGGTSFSRDVTVSSTGLLYPEPGMLVGYITSRMISREGA